MTPGHGNWRRRGLYLVTPERVDTASLLHDTAAALRGGATLVQYRDKSTDVAKRLAQALGLKSLCDEWGVPLLINDDARLAGEVRAAGVHLGEHDAGIDEARAVLGPDAIVGLSCYDDAARARRAAAQGASYVAFGAFHPSRSKSNTRQAHPSLLREARAIGLTCVAIGGITPHNARPLIDAGADLVAVISAVYDADDIASAAAQFSQLFETSHP